MNYIKPINKILAAKYSKNSNLADFKPFQKDILLFETYVAGTSYIDGIEDLEEYLEIGDHLEFFREKENIYDENAIEVLNSDHVKIGYIPKKDNIIFARLMDAGKLLFGKIINKEFKGEWVKIEIEIYLKDI